MRIQALKKMVGTRQACKLSQKLDFPSGVMLLWEEIKGAYLKLGPIHGHVDPVGVWPQPQVFLVVCIIHSVIKLFIDLRQSATNSSKKVTTFNWFGRIMDHGFHYQNLPNAQNNWSLKFLCLKCPVFEKVYSRLLAISMATYTGSSEMLRHFWTLNRISLNLWRRWASILWHRSNTSVMSSMYLALYWFRSCSHTQGWPQTQLLYQRAR